MGVVSLFWTRGFLVKEMSTRHTFGHQNASFNFRRVDSKHVFVHFFQNCVCECVFPLFFGMGPPPRRLAALGSAGQHPNHLHRDLLRTVLRHNYLHFVIGNSYA